MSVPKVDSTPSNCTFKELCIQPYSEGFKGIKAAFSQFGDCPGPCGKLNICCRRIIVLILGVLLCIPVINVIIWLAIRLITKRCIRDKVIAAGAIALTSASLSAGAHQTDSIPIPLYKTKLLCVLYDAGETGALVPVLKKLEKDGKDFRVLVMGTAETLVKPGMFGDKRLTLKDLTIETVVDTATARTTALSKEMMGKFQTIDPQVVLVGTASRIQQQVLETFPASTTVAFVDNFDYDKKQESFATVNKVQAVAKHVLCPSKHTETLFAEPETVQPGKRYHVVGKPSLEVWEQEIRTANRKQILNTLNFNNTQPIVTFIGGYGPGYEVINPLFDQYTELLEKEGFQVIRQHHPKVAEQMGIKLKVKTTEALAVSQSVIGYNSSVILDGALVEINSLFFIPEDKRTPFKHFAIDKGLIPRMTNYEELLTYVKKTTRTPPDISEQIGVPPNSTVRIEQLLNGWME